MSSLPFLTHTQLAALHRETYTQVIKGLLAWGSAKDFAAKVGITPVYLSNLLDPDHPPPSPETAERIVNALPIDPEQRYALLEHMLLARVETDHAHALLRQHSPRSDAAASQLHGLRAAYDQTILTGTQSQTSILALRDAGRALLRYLDPEAAPLQFVESCLIVHAAQCALNRWEDAYFLTCWADAVLSAFEDTIRGADQDTLAHLQINVQYATALTLRNLGLPKAALEMADKARTNLSRVPAAVREFWLPPLLREQMEGVGRLPRFALSEVEGLSGQLRTLGEQRADRQLLLLKDRALIHAYLTYDSSRSRARAGQVVREWFDHEPLLTRSTPLAYTMLLRTAARFFWQVKQQDEWSHVMRWFQRTVTAHDLKHQWSEAKREFGVTLEQMSF